MQCRPARKSRTGVGRQHFPQPLSQAGAQPHEGSAAHDGSQAGAAQAGAAQAQVGSAAAQVASQHVGAQQLPPIMRSSKPAWALEPQTKVATATKENKYDFMGRTPVPVGKRTLTQADDWMKFSAAAKPSYRRDFKAGLALLLEFAICRMFRVGQKIGSCGGALPAMRKSRRHRRFGMSCEHSSHRCAASARPDD